MNTDINLLSQRNEESLKQEGKVKILNFAAVISLVVTCAISLLIFLSIQAINLPSLRKGQDNILMKISQVQNKQVKLSLVNNRIANIQEILDKRINLSKAMSEILSKVPDRFFLDSMEIDSKTIIMTGNSSSLFAIGELINNLTDMVRKKEVISSLTLSSLVLDDAKNVYRISLISNL